MTPYKDASLMTLLPVATNYMSALTTLIEVAATDDISEALDGFYEELAKHRDGIIKYWATLGLVFDEAVERLESLDYDTVRSDE